MEREKEMATGLPKEPSWPLSLLLSLRCFALGARVMLPVCINL